MIPINAQVARLARAGRRDEVAAVMAPHRDAMLADPLGAFHGIMDTAPAEDLEVMADPRWQAGFARAPARVAAARASTAGSTRRWRWTASGTSTRHPCRRR